MPKKLTKKQKKKLNKFALSNWKVIVVLLIIIVLFAVFAYYMGWIDLLINKFRDDDDGGYSTAGGHVTEVNSFGSMQVNFLDIGQGDCIIIELPDGKNMIIDSGDNNADQKVIADFTKANNITTFDYLLLTHQDEDHVGNMDWVFENYSVKYVFRPNVYSDDPISSGVPESFNPVITDPNAKISTTEEYAKFIVSAYNEGCTTEIVNKDSDFKNTLKCGEETLDYVFNFLTPTAEKSNVHYKINNNYSPILMLEYSGRRVMFNGDAETAVLNEYVDAYGSQYNVDVYKVGHHGSSNATSSKYLSAIDPEYAVIQCGLGNKHDHPEKSVINMLLGHDSNMNIYRNDTNGNITLTISASGEMSWSFDNRDMSNNHKSGPELVEIMAQVLNISKQDTLEDILKLLEFVDTKKKIVVL